MTEDLSLVQINTQGLDTDLNGNFAALEDAVNTVSLDLSAFEAATTSALGLKANDSSVVHLAGTETIIGDKTFSGTTTIGSSTGLLKRVSGVVTNAAAGTDYLTPNSTLKVANLSLGTTATQIAIATNPFTSVAGAWTKVTGFTTSSDVLGEWNNANQRFVVTHSGIYMIRMNLAGSVSNTKAIAFYINGSLYFQSPFIQNIPNYIFTSFIEAYSGAYIEIYYYTSTSENIALGGPIYKFYS